uniref:NADH-ubiquinone oxidoreductase chain 4 n=6 Tax=Polytomella TaxID=3049 RepID=Q8LYW1_9CHLO|nr:NADH dehydrogenase subuint 4 [Polytomella parva]AAL65273.1 NADH dehydrogenase subuint 4 [Polytomella parva]7AR9_M Chain M, ND4 [Polytomella sp. Pringsheim 198.80]7ARD_M Chain M, ND4 [Polytomella sp. Pringsheim 198.80]
MSLYLFMLFLQPLSLSFVSRSFSKISSLMMSFATLWSAVYMWFTSNGANQTFYQVVSWGSDWSTFGVCYTSLYISLLCAFIFPICVILVQGYRALSILICIQTAVSLSIVSLHMLAFYALFESSLLLFFILIGRRKYGSLSAAYNISIYTFISALGFLISAFWLNWSFGSVCALLPNEEANSFVAFGIFILLWVKAPLVPFHLWLPEAHVYAPTAGSVLLAGVLLKISIVGLHVFFLPICASSIVKAFPLILSICLGSFIFSSFSTLKQIDLKKIVAYSSISHMAIVFLSSATNSGLGIQGAVLYCIAHGLISPGLFLLVGILYKNTNTKLVFYLRGLSQQAPVWWSVWVFFMLGNLAFPLFPNFIAEVVCLSALFKNHELYAYAFIFFSFVGTVYSSTVLGRLKGGVSSQCVDASRLDVISWNPLVLATVVTGIGYM